MPIFKKGDKTLMANHRPVNLASIVDEIMDSVIARNMREHFGEAQLDK